MFANIDSKIIGTIILNIFIAILIPLVTDHYKWTSGADSILLGVLVGIFLASIQLLHFTSSILDRDKIEQKLWQTKDNFDVKLANIREAYSKILNFRKDIPDLFQNFFDNRLADLEKMIVETASRDELHLEQSHVVSINVLLGSFRGDSKDIFRPVHFLEDNDFFFDIYAKQYFHSVYKLLLEGKIKEVRRLMVYGNYDELKDPRSIKLMSFHDVTKGYSYRVMRKNDFYSMLKDHNLSVPRDFGIYGDKYLYVAEVNLAQNIVGYWARSHSTLADFIRFFDSCWESPISKPPEDIIIEKDISISIDDLYKN